LTAVVPFLLEDRLKERGGVYIGAAALRSAKLVKNSTSLKVYKCVPHGLADTHKEQLNDDLLSFLKVETLVGARFPAQRQ
jgi:hypothetical protein